MPVDASIYNLANQPTVPLLGPAQLNALALQRQQIQGGALSLQQQRQAISDEQATRAAIRSYYGDQGSQAPANALAAPQPAPAPAMAPSSTLPVNPNGAALPTAPAFTPPPAAPAPVAAPAPAPQVPTRPPVPTVGDLVRRGVPPAQASAMVQSFQKIDENSATIDKTRADAAKAAQDTNDLIGQQQSDMANMLVKSTAPGQAINQDLLGWHLQHFASLGPQQAAQAQQVAAHLAQLGSDDQIALLKSLAGTPKTLDANAATATAAEKTQTSNREAANQARSQGLSALAAAPNSAAYGAIWQKLPPEVRADPAIPNPAAWNASTPALVRNLGMSTEQQATTGQAAANAAQTARYQNAELGQGAARLGIERSRLGIEQAKFDQRGGALGLLSPADQAIAGKLAVGDFNPAQLGRMPNKEAIIAGAIEQNPAWTPQIYNTKQAFFDPDKQQSKNLGTVSRIVGHIGRFEANSESAGYNLPYAYGASITGNSAALNEDAHAISGELEKLVSGGVGSDTQMKAWSDSLHSSRAGVRETAINEISHLVGSQYEGMNQTYKAATGQDLPMDKLVSPAGLAWMQAKGIRGVPTASAAAPATPTAPAGSVSVTDPNGGVHLFPDAATAQTFKSKAGIK